MYGIIKKCIALIVALVYIIGGLVFQTPNLSLWAAAESPSDGIPCPFFFQEEALGPEAVSGPWRYALRLSDGYAVITSCNLDSTSVSIPAILDGHDVVGLSSGSLSGKTQAILHGNILYIAEDTFGNSTPRITALNGTYGQYWAYIHNFPFTTGKDYDLVHGVIDYTDVQQGRIQRRGEEYIAFNRLEALRLSVGSLIWFRDSRGFDSFYRVTELMDSGDQVLAAIQRPDKISDAVINYQNTQEIMMRPSDFVPAEGVLVGSNSSTSKTTAIIPEEEETLFEITPSQFEKKYGNNESSKGKFKASAKGKISTKILYTIKIENGITKTCEMVETETLDIGVTFEAGACTNMLKEHGKAEKIIQDAADGNNPNEEQKNFLKKYLGNDSFSITENGNTGGISGIDIKNMQEILFNKKEKALEESKFKHPMRLGHYHFQTFWFNLTVDFKVNLELSGKATLSSYKSTTTKKHWVPDPNDPDDPEKGEWVIDYSNGNVTTDETGATLKAEGKGKITGEIEVSCGLFFLSDISLKIKGGVEATIECKINYSDGIFDFPCAVVTVSPFLEISAYTGIWVGESTGWKHEIFSKKWTAAQLLGKPHFLQIHAHLKYGSHVPEQCPLNDTCTVKYETKTSTILNDIKLIKNEILSRNINKKLDDHPEYGTFRGWAYNISDTEPTAADVNGEFKFADNGAIEKDQTNGIDRIRILQNLTLYAIWENSAVITFDSAGGTIIEDQCIPVGGYITMPPVPQKEGSIFTGWIIDPSNPRYWDFDRDPVQGDMTLTATWIDGNAPSGGTENVTYIGRLTDVSAESLFFTNHGEIYPGLFQYEIKQVPGSSDAKYIRITGVNNNPEHLIIPNELTILFGDDDSTLPVRDIAEDAFRNCIGLKSVSFKTENVSIDSNFMFYGCTNLEYVELPSLDDGKLGNNAFDGCKNLKCVQFQPGLSALDDCAFDGCEGINGDIDLSELSSVGIATFRNCTGIKSVIIGNKLLSIPDELFSGCSGIEHLDLGNNINTIGNYAFYGCEHINGDIDLSKLSSVGIGAFKNCTGIKSAIIGNNLSLIPNELFSGCNKIEHLSLGKNTNAIGDYAFDGCEGITGDIDLSELSSVGIAAFRNCTGIKSVIIGNKLSSIPNELFSGCSGIEHLDLGNSINAINDWAFKDCTGLKNLYIPDSVKYISARGEKIIQTNYLLSAFRGCNELETISIGGVETVEKNMFPLEKDKVHNLKQVTIRGSVKVIGHNAFSDAGWPVNSFSALTDENNSIEVIIEEGVESIEGGAFHWCSGISYLQLPSTITSIGDYAFEGCTEMQADMDLSHVTTLGEGAFASCDNIRSIDISSATSLGNSVFSYCTSLESVIFNNQLFSIPDNAFSHCTNLKELNIPDSVTELGNAAFSYCTSLTSLYIPDSVAKISTDRDNWTFKNCTGVKTINIGGVETLMPKMLPLYSCETIIVRGSVKHIADEAFSFLTNYSLQDQNNSVIIILDEGIETIGYAAFKNCYGISGIEIPSTITSIGKNAFSNCSNMKGDIDISKVTEIGEGAFYNCSSITSVLVSSTLTSIGSNAFTGCNKLMVYITEENAYAAAYCDANQIPYVYLQNANFTLQLNPNNDEDIIISQINNGTELNLPVPVWDGHIFSGWYEDESFTHICARTVMPSHDLSLYASWDLNLFTLTVISNGEGFRSNPVYTIPAGQVIDIPIPIRQGYFFSGWTLDPEGLLPFDGIMPAGHTTVYAQWKPESVNGQYQLFDDHAVLIKYRLLEEESKNVYLPETVAGLPLTEIASYAFTESDVQTVFIPPTVTDIQQDAFLGANTLSAVHVSPANDAYLSIDGILYSRDGTILLFCPASHGRHINIPNKVTEIGAHAFAATSLSSISLPASLIKIGEYAFSNTYLHELILPQNLYEICDRAFSGCRSLTLIIAKNSPEVIGESAFEDCNPFMVAYGPDIECALRESILNSGYLYNVHTLEINLNGKVRTYHLPSGTSLMLLETPELGENLLFTGWYQDENLDIPFTDIIMPNKDLTIWAGSQQLFICETISNENTATTLKISGCNIPDDTAVIPQSINGLTITAIGTGSFDDRFTIVSIPASVVMIEEGAFAEGTSLITETGSYAESWAEEHLFNTEEKVWELVWKTNCETNIPSQMLHAGDPIQLPIPVRSAYAFLGWYWDESLSIPTDENPIMPTGDAALYASWEIIDESLATILENLNWTDDGEAIKITDYTGKATILSLPSEINGLPVTSIGDMAFAYNQSLTEIIIPNTVTEIGKQAFYAMHNLQQVTLSENLTSLQTGTFENCTSLSQINLPEGLQTIGANAFSDTGLTALQLPSTLMSIDATALKKCNNLTFINVANGNPYFESRNGVLFDTADGILVRYPPAKQDTIYTVTNIWSIGAWAFYGAEHLTEIILSQDVYSLGTGAFAYCSKLTAMPITGSLLTRIPEQCFYACGKLQEVELSPTIRYIGSRAFHGIGITELTIPESVTEIGANAADPFVVIRGENGTYAQVWANENHYTFIPLNSTAIEEIVLANDQIVMKRGEKTALSFSLVPEYAEPNNLSFTSEDPKIISVDESGNLYAIGGGETQIYISAPGEVYASCRVIVEVDVNSISLDTDYIEMNIGDSRELTVQLLPLKVTNREIAWSSSDETVLTINEDNKIIAVNGGYAIVRATAHNGLYSECNVLVHKWSDPVYEWKENNTLVTAARTCMIDNSTIEEETVGTSAVVTKEADCENPGETTYTSESFQNPAFTIQTKTEADISALGHLWNSPTYIWNENNSQVTGTLVCMRDESHEKTETVSTQRKILISPTRINPGIWQWVSEEFENSAFSIQQHDGGTVDALENMNTLWLPTNLKSIESEAFAGISAEAIVVPDGCITIETNAFENCTALLYIWIPTGVDVQPDAFSGCPNVIIDQAEE